MAAFLFATENIVFVSAIVLIGQHLLPIFVGHAAAVDRHPAALIGGDGRKAPSQA
ncbi:hypothetical protein Sj15T_32100 [Sphingobium sp. TA15]|uniref:Uncharacterized protein n=1 Tax=Sphingobium indicum (strain DSM 16413 / CCM 7287 / MTCC 6362 / UT26 / NBRC 101211 / UT26S) TaxID=452662 RepID=D4YYH7_SPHIU|nr:hypothetical protein [Sphingobium indicum]BAI95409.1 hypothetical protein SJA_C1-05750 [Sphingobium indicum UT26S]BDD68189.1 hypothetical protein Sj15T_32100 [Sphingobium sp. TA15]